MPLKCKEFKSKRVYLVGGSMGIGLAAGRLFAKMGSDVIIFARNVPGLEKATIEIDAFKASETQKISWLKLDISKKDDIKAVMASAVKTFGEPDILINCAGRAYPHYFEDVTDEQLDETMAINFTGQWHTIKSLLPYLKKNRGYIVNVSSMVGFLGVFGYTDYAASKFAVMGFSEALKSELKKHDIGVSVLCPPDTDTPGFKIENTTKPAETKAVSEGGGIMTPGDVAAEMIRGMKKGSFLIIPGMDGKLVYTMKRYAPWLVDMVMDSQIKKVQKKGN
jgi:3-dehydrosphinganine reductase